jgi:membrane protein DedA with SNARE-associated domain
MEFLVADAVAAGLWAVYASMLGYIGGETFKESLWLPLAASLAVAMLVGLALEAWRRLQRRRGRDVLGDQLPEGSAHR